ncbi:MAG: DUF1501 domain-containing protein, partial [Armatimonadetes bacterium]|nr:DUF1501 domain-containing protein [Armatimonadota bacterium]
LFGGPSQLETFDMKPDAPSAVRGPYQPTRSRSDGLLVCEHLPKLARMSDRYAVVRTVHHPQNDHNACHYIQTGHPMPPAPRGAAGVDATDRDWPAMGSVIEYLDHQAAGGRPRAVPSYVYLPNRLGHIEGYDRLGQYGGWLGRGYDALATDIRKQSKEDNPYFRVCSDPELDFRIKGMAGRDQLTLDRLDRRRSLLTQFDSERRKLDGSRPAGEYDAYQQAALGLVAAGKIHEALDIRREKEAVRDRYGRHLFGQSMLMGRRMIEAGARFVTVLWDAPDGYSWDSHRNSDDVGKHLLPGLDQSLSALLSDMGDRGLLQETLVVCLGEMGRTPKGKAGWGRDHWSYCFPALFAGAGIRGGAVYGKSDAEAAFPVEHPVSPEDLACTLFDALGVDPHSTIPDRESRPTSLIEGGRPLRELFG